MPDFRSIFRSVCLAVALGASASCASTRDGGTTIGDPGDPLEPLNRHVLRFNVELDKVTLKPLSEVYVFIVHEEIREGIGNVYTLLDSPVDIANTALQGKFDQTAWMTGRLLVNATLGFGGWFDFATRLGMPYYDEDFGQTLAVWGFEDGAYLVLPLLGPSTVRDVIGRGVDMGFSPSTYVFTVHNVGGCAASCSYSGAQALSRRAGVKVDYEDLERSSVDFYAALRNLYRQSRRAQINDGRIDVEELPDLPDLADPDAFDEADNDDEADPDGRDRRDSNAEAAGET